jgi:hypothetical protein
MRLLSTYHLLPNNIKIKEQQSTILPQTNMKQTLRHEKTMNKIIGLILIARCKEKQKNMSSNSKKCINEI